LEFQIVYALFKPGILIVVDRKLSLSLVRWGLHVAIQDAMGWLDYHLHAFHIRRKHGHSVVEIGIPEVDGFEDEREILPGWEIPVSRYFNDIGVRAEYEYDFGDDWMQDVLFEGILLK